MFRMLHVLIPVRKKEAQGSTCHCLRYKPSCLHDSLPCKTVTTMLHYSDVIKSTMASEITSLTIVYSTVYSGPNQRKHQSFASLAFVQGIHQSPVNSLHKGPVTQKMFPFEDVIMHIHTIISIITFLDPCIPHTEIIKSSQSAISREISLIKGSIFQENIKCI